MKHLIMECRLSYAVALDEEGSFHKVANLGYEVGQTVEDVMYMRIPKQNTRRKRGAIYTIGSLCACMLLLFCMAQYTVCTDVYVTVNPDVCIELNWFANVRRVTPRNEDAAALLQDYDAQGQDLQSTMNEVLHLCIQEGYLSDAEDVQVRIQSRMNRAAVKAQRDADMVLQNISTELSSPQLEEPIIQTITIPQQNNNYDGHSDYSGDSDYSTDDDDHDSDYEPIGNYDVSDYAGSDYDDSDYEPDDSRIESDYDSSDFGHTDDD